ncbi:phage minor capsid protein [Nocardia sp. CC227C]|uniref:phage minor capsid protein n=1 Tax=Nocardia sp. CC227C TaxID=3044562 RepID=UPI00278C72F2|nr:phage minor capsid protein [Nocardia sp. CC227C]
MPLKPTFGDQLARPVVARYEAAEQSVLKWLARILAPIPGAYWLVKMLARLLRLRRGIAKVIESLTRDARPLVDDAVSQAWEYGHANALTDLHIDARDADSGRARDIADDVYARVAATHPRIARWAEEAFRRAVDAARDPAFTDAERAAAIQRSLSGDAARGVTGYVSASGRHYSLTSYVETAIRASVTYAEVEAYTQTLAAQGHDLVVVSDVPQACVLCTPFEGRVLSITGQTRGTYTATNRVGQEVAVRVFASIADSRRDGLWHHGCRHVVSVWTPDSPLPPADSVPDREGYRDSQRRRARERRVRAQERVAAVAPSTTAQRTARRELVAATARRHDSDSDRSQLSFMAGGDRGSGQPPDQPKQPAPIPPSPFDAATSPQEVADILSSRYGLNTVGFDLPGVDLEAAREYGRALHDMLAKYPDIDLRTVGIRDITEFLAPDDDPADVYAVTKGARRRSDGHEYAKAIWLNVIYATDAERMREAWAGSIASGKHPKVFAARPYYAAIVHEFGHAIEHAGKRHAREVAEQTLVDYWHPRNPLEPGERDAQRMLRYLQWRARLSLYSFEDGPFGKLNPAEALANAFAEVEIGGDRASEPAKVLHQLLLRMSTPGGGR